MYISNLSRFERMMLEHILEAQIKDVFYYTNGFVNVDSLKFIEEKECSATDGFIDRPEDYILVKYYVRVKTKQPHCPCERNGLNASTIFGGNVTFYINVKTNTIDYIIHPTANSLYPTSERPSWKFNENIKMDTILWLVEELIKSVGGDYSDIYRFRDSMMYTAERPSELDESLSYIPCDSYIVLNLDVELYEDPDYIYVLLNNGQPTAILRAGCYNSVLGKDDIEWVAEGISKTSQKAVKSFE